MGERMGNLFLQRRGGASVGGGVAAQGDSGEEGEVHLVHHTRHRLCKPQRKLGGKSIYTYVLKWKKGGRNRDLIWLRCLSEQKRELDTHPVELLLCSAYEA
jgi:hypothetical protein